MITLSWWSASDGATSIWNLDDNTVQEVVVFEVSLILYSFSSSVTV